MVRLPLVAPVHARRGGAALCEASPATRAHLDDLLQRTKSPAEHSVLMKAIGARRESIDNEATQNELAWLADRIRGKSDAWLAKHTRCELPGLSPFGCVSSTTATAWLGSDVIEAVKANRSIFHRVAASLSHDYTSFVMTRGPHSVFAWVALQAAAACVDLITGTAWKNGGPSSLASSPTPPGCALGVLYSDMQWIEPAQRPIDLNTLERTVREGYDVFVRVVELNKNNTGYRAHMVLLTGVDTAIGGRRWRVYDSGQLRTSYEVSDTDLLDTWRGNDKRFVASISVPSEGIA